MKSKKFRQVIGQSCTAGRSSTNLGDSLEALRAAGVAAAAAAGAYFLPPLTVNQGNKRLVIQLALAYSYTQCSGCPHRNGD